MIGSKYNPINLIMIYFIFVYIIFQFGPWPWPNQNPELIFIFLFVSHFILYIGYVISINKKRKYKIIEKTYIFKFNFMTVLKYLIVINFILIIPIFFFRSEANFSLSTIINLINNGLYNPGELYHIKLEREAGKASLLFLILTICYCFLKYLIVPNVIYFWSEINGIYKYLMIFTLIIEVMSWIAIGTNKGIFDNIFIIIVSYFIKYNFSNKKLNLKYIIFVLILMSTILTFFANSIISRSGKLQTYNKFANVSVDYNNALLKLLPQNMQDIFIVMTSYLTQGYYGLSLALTEPFKSTYGFGSSWFLMNIYDIFFERQVIEERSYLYRLKEHGWQPDINWHSIYTWLASDYSFIGVVILMFIIGKIFGNVTRDCLEESNHISRSLFTLLIIMFIYFPMNNQIFSFADTFATFWLLFIIYLFSNKFHILRFEGSKL